MKIKQLFTNNDGKASTTSTIQFLGFVGLLSVLGYSVYLDRTYVPELYSVFAMYCGGLVVTKGAVSAYKTKHKHKKYSQPEQQGGL